MRAQSVAGNSPSTHKQVPVTSALFSSIELLGAPMTFKKGAEIYGENEPADFVYKLVSGSACTYKILADGRRQIQSFYFQGDVFGLEAGPDHDASAEAISSATVLVIRRSTILATATRDSDVANQLLVCTSRELRNAREHAMLLVKTARERVAAFLLQLADRISGNAVDLPMSRKDIADYLGISIETVSRTFTQFQDEAAIELLSSRRVVLRNRLALTNLTA